MCIVHAHAHAHAHAHVHVHVHVSSGPLFHEPFSRWAPLYLFAVFWRVAAGVVTGVWRRGQRATKGPKAGVSRWLRVGKANPFGGEVFFLQMALSHTLLFFSSSAVTSPHLSFSSSSSSSSFLLLLLLLLLLACLRLGLALQDDVLFPSLFTSL